MCPDTGTEHAAVVDVCMHVRVQVEAQITNVVTFMQDCDSDVPLC